MVVACHAERYGRTAVGADQIEHDGTVRGLSSFVQHVISGHRCIRLDLKSSRDGRLLDGVGSV